jgi:Nuclease-related domain
LQQWSRRFGFGGYFRSRDTSIEASAASAHIADALEELRSDGYKPVHDIVGNGFNIDHVIVGPGGVFAIETKYRSGKGQITFRNTEGVLVGDRLEEKDCLKQARANAAAVSDLIRETCGRREWVTPIVVFVGDWKIKDEWHETNTRVFTPDQLSRYIRNQQPQLTRKEIELIASHLERSAKG